MTVTRTVTGDPRDNNGTFVISAIYQPDSGMWRVDDYFDL
jgi:hypothetical protein